MQLDQLFTPHTRIYSKWIKDLNLTSQTIKIIKENIARKISDITCSNILSDIKGNKRKNKYDYIKVKSFFHSKGNHQQNKKPTE